MRDSSRQAPGGKVTVSWRGDPVGPLLGAGASDVTLVERLRAGDEDVFRELVNAWSPGMFRLARTFVSGPESAQDVVQDAWLGVINGLRRFEGRSSLRCWVFTIAANRARTRARKEARTIPLSQLTMDGEAGPTVDPARFQGPDGEDPGHWTAAGAPQVWHASPERQTLAAEAIALVEAAVEQLPARQGLVVTMRDIHGFTAEETCTVLEISPQNQRVLLHRARAALRGALEEYYRC